MSNIVESLYRLNGASDANLKLTESSTQTSIDPSNLDKSVEGLIFKINEKTLLGNFYDLFYVAPNGDIADEPYLVRRNYMSLDKNNNVFLRKNSEIEFFLSSKNGWGMKVYSDGVDCGTFYNIGNMPILKVDM